MSILMLMESFPSRVQLYLIFKLHAFAYRCKNSHKKKAIVMFLGFVDCLSLQYKIDLCPRAVKKHTTYRARSAALLAA